MHPPPPRDAYAEPLGALGHFPGQPNPQERIGRGDADVKDTGEGRLRRLATEPAEARADEVAKEPSTVLTAPTPYRRLLWIL